MSKAVEAPSIEAAALIATNVIGELEQIARFAVKDGDLGFRMDLRIQLAKDLLSPFLPAGAQP